MVTTIDSASIAEPTAQVRRAGTRTSCVIILRLYDIQALTQICTVPQSYEKQPPGTTFFWVLDQPENGGGDTLFLSQVEAYKRLSPEFQKRLEGLRAVHSAVEQAEYSRKRGGPVRREPVETEVRGLR